MIDFNVPANPEWGKRLREKHGDAVDDDAQVASPAFKRAAQKSRSTKKTSEEAQATVVGIVEIDEAIEQELTKT